MKLINLNIKRPTKEQRKKIINLFIIFIALLAINIFVVYRLTSSTFQNELNETKKELSDNNQNQISLALEQVELLLTKIDQLETNSSTKLSSIATENQSISILLSEHRLLITDIFSKHEKQDNTINFARVERIKQTNEITQIRLAIDDIYQQLDSKHTPRNNTSSIQETKSKSELKYTNVIRFDRWNGEFIIVAKQNDRLLKLRAGNILQDEKEWSIKSINKTRAILVSDDETLTVSNPL